jgi:uncharacterized membrane protein YkoI
MFPARLRSKRIWIPSVLALLGLGVAGTVWATTASADDLGGSERDRVVAAAKTAAGDGDVVSAESSDRDRDDTDADDRNEAYEVEIRKADGTEVDVKLDKDLKVIGQEADDDNGRDDDATDAPEADDRALSADERSSAGKAATAAVGGGTVTAVEASDDRGVAYEVDVRKVGGTEWDIDLDSSFDVVSKHLDR